MAVPLGRRPMFGLPIGRFKVFDNRIRNFALFVLSQRSTPRQRHIDVVAPTPDREVRGHRSARRTFYFE
jgi:hypothetical protein